MADDKISTPTSSGGITRFYDVTTSKIQLDPRVVVGFSFAVIIVEVILHVMR